MFYLLAHIRNLLVFHIHRFIHQLFHISLRVLHRRFHLALQLHHWPRRYLRMMNLDYDSNYCRKKEQESSVNVYSRRLVSQLLLSIPFYKQRKSNHFSQLWQNHQKRDITLQRIIQLFSLPVELQWMSMVSIPHCVTSCSDM